MFKGIITPEMHYDDWAQQYDSDVAGWDYHAPQQVLAKAKNFLKDHPEQPKLLDVGIGTGLLSAMCRKVKDDIHVTGVDISNEMLNLCHEKKIANELRRVDVSRDKFPYEDEQFDLTLASGLMENVENIENTLTEMARVTRPGGLIAFTYMPTTRHPLREKLAKKLRPGRTEEGRFVMGDLNLFRHNPEVVKTLAQTAGAQQVSVDSFVGYRTYVVMTVRYDLFVGRKVKGLQ